ncbi:PstS family phosphate ABC transporter substrate-binding protein [Bradyrhizobium genosp. P]|uniref:PstS family phosphate ABC transporter substrate-binding protein n=1 Tax=Bradyrhizobium genosp. P TaxID=83641 RepID=UPI003CF6FF8E
MSARLFAVALMAQCVGYTSAYALDQQLPNYVPMQGTAGSLKSVGSDTLKNEMELWATGFMAVYPGVKIDVDAKGSATAPPALLEGAAQFAPMSRPMNSVELDAFKTKYGYPVLQFRVAVDALAVYVNKANPIPCLSIAQLNRIFSSSRVAAFGPDIALWGDAGLTGEWAAKPIIVYGRNELSGTYAFFQEMALYSGDYKKDVKLQPGSEAVVQNVANDRFAIGYSGIGYKTEGVRTVPLSAVQGGQCFDTSEEATYSGKYPLARYLYIYLNKKPDQPLDPLRSEFIKYILSKDGQIQTEKGGFFPIANDIREQELRKLGISSPSH